MFIDAETNTAWSAAGVAVESDAVPKGTKLRPLEVEEDLVLDVMKHWYPTLQLAKPLEPAVPEARPQTSPSPHRAARHKPTPSPR